MQVRKFEAKNMKEALALVKQHMGPDAIILSARDISKSFGLVGQHSVEVTAAVSEATLRKKQIAERKLPTQHREKFNEAPARKQKEFIEKVFARKENDTQRRPLTSTPYIQIRDEEEAAAQAQVVAATGAGSISPETARQRIRSAAQAALTAVDRAFVEEEPRAIRAPRVSPSSGEDIHLLKSEIQRLKSVIEQFQKVPQSLITSMHPGASHGIPYDLSAMFEKLTRAGISVENTVEILESAQTALPAAQVKNRALVDAWVARYLLDRIRISDNRTADRYHVFMGPSGQGKTSCLVKLASHLVIVEKKKVAIVTADLYKVGAVEQLRIFSQILNVPFAQLRRRSDWDVFNARLKHMDYILVDFPASNLRSVAETESLKELLPPEENGRALHYVQSVLAKDSDAFELAQRYQALGFRDVIFTQLDESVQHGLIYNFQKRFQVPLHSFGIGPQIPEDFEPATKERVVDLIFKLTKIRKDRG